MDDVIEPADSDALPTSTRRGHAKVPDRLDDDNLALATERERVDAGLKDYADYDLPEARSGGSGRSTRKDLRRVADVS